MSRYSAQFTDDSTGVPRPISGAKVYVYRQSDGGLASILSDTGDAANPITTDADGNFHFNATEGIYDLVYTVTGSAVYRENGVVVGDPGSIFKGDPGSPGEGYPTRSAMAAATATNLDDAYLTEPGREGKFIFSTANLSSQVAADPRQGVYVAPASDTDGSSGAWVRVTSGVGLAEWFGAVGDGTTDDKAAIQAALDHAAFSEVQSLGKTYAIASQIVIPTGKSWRGISRSKTIISVLDSYAPRTAGFNQAITCSNTAVGVKCTDMTIDVRKVGLGLGTSQRVCGFVPSGQDFYFARLRAQDVSAYSFWSFGKVNGTPCSGVLEDCISENADIHFESSKADGVKWVRCHASEGDGDLPNASVFHPYDGSTNIEYLYCSCSGSFSSPMHSIADTFDINVRLIHCNIYTDYADAPALQPTGNYNTELEIVGGQYVSTAGIAANLANGTDGRGVTLRATSARFSGYQIGVGVNSQCFAYMSHCELIGETAEGSGLGTNALYNDGTAVVDGYRLLATGGFPSTVGGSGTTGISDLTEQTPAPAGAGSDETVVGDLTVQGGELFIQDAATPYLRLYVNGTHLGYLGAASNGVYLNAQSGALKFLFANTDVAQITAAGLDMTGAGSGILVGSQKVVANRGTAVANPTGGSVVDVECRAALITLLDRLRPTAGHGLIA